MTTQVLNASATRNFLLAGGARAQDRNRKSGFTASSPSILQEVKAENERLAALLNQEKSSHQQQLEELQQKLRSAERSAQDKLTEQDSFLEEQKSFLQDYKKNAAHMAQELESLKNQIEEERLKRQNAESATSKSTKRAKHFQKLYEKASQVESSREIATQEANCVRASADVARRSSNPKQESKDAYSLVEGDAAKQHSACKAVGICHSELVVSLEAEVDASRRQINTLRMALSSSDCQLAALQAELSSAESLASEQAGRFSLRLQTLEENLDDKEMNLRELRQAVDSAKDTILSQNQHIASQDMLAHELRQKTLDKAKETEAKCNSLQSQNVLFCTQVERLQKRLQEKTSEMETTKAFSSTKDQRTEGCVEEASILAEQLEDTHRQIAKLTANEASQASAILLAQKSQQAAEELLDRLKAQLRETTKKEQDARKRSKILQRQLDALEASHADALMQAQEKISMLDDSRERWQVEQARLEEKQQRCDEEEQDMHCKVQELAAIIEHLREDLRLIHQLKQDATTRQKMSESQCERLNDRQRASEAKIKDLRSQIARISREQQREQQYRSHLLSELTCTIQVEETAKLAAQKEARVTRRKLAQVEVKLMETNNAKTKAEMICQKVEADLAVMKSSQKRLQSENFKLQNNWKDWTQRSSNLLEDCIREESSKFAAVKQQKRIISDE